MAKKLSREESRLLAKFRDLTVEIESNSDLCGFTVPGWELREVAQYAQVTRVVGSKKK